MKITRLFNGSLRFLLLFVFFQTGLKYSANAQCSVSAGADVSICQGSKFTRTATTSSTGPQYKWYAVGNSTNIFSTSSTIDVQVKTVGITKYVVEMTTSVSGVNCTALDTVNVTVNPSPSVNAGPDITFCQSTSKSITATYSPSNGSITWYTLGSTPPTSPNGATFNVPNSPAGTFNYVVKIDSTGGGFTCSDFDTVKVVVNPKPVANFSYTTNCGRTVNFSNSSSTASGNITKYNWDFGVNASASLSSQINPSLKYPSPSTNYPTKLVVTNNFGCMDSVTKTVSTLPSPVANLTSNLNVTIINGETYFYKCSSTSNSVEFTNISTGLSNSANYTIKWGDNTPDEILTQQNFSPGKKISHVYTNGVYVLTFIAKDGNCSDEVKYIIWNADQPGGGITTPPRKPMCVGSRFPVLLRDISGNAKGTKYYVTFNDGTPPVILTHPVSNDTIWHTFNKSSCSSSSGPATEFQADLYIPNPCGPATEGSVKPFFIVTPPKADFSISPDDTVCVSQTVTFTNTGDQGNNIIFSSGSATCQPSNLIWSISPSIPSTIFNITSGSLGSTNGYSTPSNWVTGSSSLNVVFNNSGIYNVKLKVGNIFDPTNQYSCGNDSISKPICVNPIPTADFTYTPNNGCAPLRVDAKGLTNTPTCGQNTFLWTVDYAAPTDGCIPASSDYGFLDGTSSTSQNPVFNFVNPGTYTIKLQTIAPNARCSSNVVSKQVVVKGKPAISIGGIPADICLAESITASSSIKCDIASATYLWTFPNGTPATSAIQNPGTVSFSSAGNKNITLKVTNSCGESTVTSNLNILQPVTVNAGNDFSKCKNDPVVTLSGSPAGGTWSGPGVTGNTFNPTLASVGTNVLTYTLGSGNCTYQDQVTVTVNAVPSLPVVNPNITLCQNQVSSPLTATGTNLLWYTTLNGTGSSTAPTPSSSSIGSQTYYVSQTVNGCTSDKSTINVNVNALATAPNVTTPINYCQNDPAVPLSASGSSLLWYTTSMGGTGLTTPPTPSTTNTGATTYYVSQVTGCGESPRASIVINVTKKPSASISYTRPNICSVSNSATTPNPPIPVERTGDAGGTYTISPNTGLPINSSTGELTPSGATPGKYTITYTLTGTGGCKDFTTTATVDVSAAPTATISYDPVCGSDASAQVKLTGSVGGEFTSTAGLSINKNTGAITPTSSTPGSYEVTYTIAPSSPCPGFTTKATVVITKAPQAAISYKLVNLCNVANSATTPNPPIPVERTGDAGGSYTISPNTGLPINASTGELTPSGATPGKYTITYTLTGTGGCKDFTATATVDVSAAPTASISYDPICGSDASAQVKLTGSVGGEYTSTAGLTINKNTGAITPTSSTPGSYEVTYTITPSAPCPGFTTKATVVITKAPSATISYKSTNLCNVADGTSTPNPPIPVVRTGDAGGSYTISPNTGLPINASTGELTPSGATPGKYTITYTLTGTGGCKDFTTTATVDVSAAPTASISYDPVCGSDASAQVKLTGSVGGEFTSTAGLTINKNTGAITPTSSTPGSYEVTYTIAPSSPCPGFTTKATVVITKAPEASISYTPANLCNVKDGNSTPNPPIPVVRTGDAGGTYTISPNTGLPINASTGDLTPSEATPGKYTITYTLTGTGGCKDFTTTATVDVSAAPTATISYDPICGSDGSAQVKFSGSTGGEYTSTSGLTIDKITGAITPTSSTPGNYEVTYTIAPSSPCPGFTTKATVVITKAPEASISYTPANLCNVKDGTSTPNPPIPVVRKGDAGGTYTISPNTGLPIDASTGELTPSEATPGKYTITYMLTGTGGCKDFTTTATVDVIAAPTATISYDPICGSDASAQVKFSGSIGGEYTSTTGLTIDKNTGAITPTSSTPGTYEVTYTIAPSLPCPGFITKTTVVITKAPAATIVYNPSIVCNVDNSSSTPNPDVDVTLTGDNGGVYSIVPNSGLPIDATTGKIIPSNSTAGEYEITYSITGIGGCANFSTSTKITVNDAPKATINYLGSPFCGGISTPQSVSLTGVTTGSFSSSADLSIDPVTGAINPSLSKPGTYTVTYTILPSPPCPGFITSTSVTIDESPKLEFDKISASICSGGTLTYIPTSTVANTVYNWSVKGAALPNNINGPLSGTVVSPQKDISISYTNTGTVSETLIIEVTPVNPTSSPCSGPVYSLTAIVNPIPPPPKVQDTLRFCQGSVATEMTAESLPGNTLIWYDENQNKLISAPTPSTNNPDTIYYFVSQTDPNCESPKSKIVVIVNPTPKIIASSFKNPTKCGLPSGSITLTIVDLNNNPIVNTPVFVQYDKFQTIYKVKDTSDASGIVKVDLTAGTYSDISVEAFECSSTKIPDVFILSDPNPPTKPIAGYNPPVCSENELNLSASSATSNLIDPVDYVWVGPAFGTTPDTTRNTVYSFPSANTSYNGTYIVYAIQNNCISLPANFSVNILQSPVKPTITTRAPLCIGDALSLQATSFLPGQNPNPTLNYTWTGPGRGFPVNAPNAQINSVIIKDAGVYTITVFSPATGCSSKTDTLIGIGGYPIVDLGQSPLTLPTGQILDLNPQIVNAAEANILPIKVFEWNPSANISCDDAVCGAPKLAVKNNACYAVKATNIYGCSGSDTICIKVFCENTQVFIPNGFVPQGGLPENSIFMVRGSGIGSIKSFRVFNRWGQIVFERSNFPPNSPAYGWDGKVNGVLAEPGVFVYTAEVICDNGIPYFYKGNVTLIR